VQLHPNIDPQGPSTKDKATLDSTKISIKHSILLPPHTARLEKEAHQEKWPNLIKAAREFKLNRLEEGRTGERIGFVTAGISYCYLIQALRECGMEGHFPVLKLGLTFPVDPEPVKELLKRCSMVVVVEEKRRFIEAQLRDMLLEMKQKNEIGFMPEIWGKTFPGALAGFPAEHGLNTGVVLKRLGPLFEQMGLASQESRAAFQLSNSVDAYDVRVPARTPTFCPGCPHRDSSSIFLDLRKDLRDPIYMKKNHGLGSMDILFHGDAGCYSMLYFPPNEGLMHNYSGMGLGGGTGAGLSPFTTNKSVSFIGDSTFFHSGMSAVSDAVKNNQDILFVVLDNKTTAMTGHQPHPGSDYDLMGQPTYAQDAARALKGLTYGREIPVVRVNPEKRDEYRAALEDLILLPGVKFVVADKECGITYHRRRRRVRSKTLAEKGYLPIEVRVNVASDVCEYCLECTTTTGCPGLTVEETLLGLKIATDLSNCVSDKACARVKACPSFEELTITRVQPHSRPDMPLSETLPEPPAPVGFDSEWRAYVAGIGGMGIGSTTSVLVRAGIKAGYHVTFCDKKGLAIRNGGVYSHITYTRDGRVVSPIIPYAKADLILGLDILEAARGMDPRMNLRVGSPERTQCVVNTAKNHTILSLLGRDSFDPRDLERAIRRHTKSYFGADVSSIAQRWLGNTLHVNVMLLGAAAQRGLLPFSVEDLTWAITTSFRPEEAGRNMKAFTLGRDLVVHPERYSEEAPETLEQMIDRKTAALGLRGNDYRDLVLDAFMRLELDEPWRRHLALRLYELICYQDSDYAKSYLKLVQSVRDKDQAEMGWKATHAAIQYAFKVMAIKDEVYVSDLLTRREKYERDARRFGVDLAAGDRISYKHYNRPSFEIFGKEFAFDLEARDWMLKIMRNLGFGRRLLPGWHRAEREFREWYLGLANSFSWKNPAQYHTWVKLLQLPEEVRGYRTVRYPKMAKARQQATELLQALAKQETEPDWPAVARG
jgi:indolepyruvate ferredoxin oxidoreductase